MSELLNKYVVDLTDEDLEALATPLGLPGLPYPMMNKAGAMQSGKKDATPLGVIQDAENPMLVFSEREYAEIIGIAYRDMPVPSHLPLLMKALRRMHPDSMNRTMMLLGDPAFGKSHLGKTLARMGTKKGTYVFDCGGKNMSSILWETVLDIKSSRSFYDEIDTRLAEGRLKQPSVGMLKKALGTAFSEEKGRRAIDWNAVVNAEEVVETLRKVAEVEGITLQSENSLGVTMQPGALIRAWQEGRPILLDEYNKSRLGSDDCLQTVWQFMTGEDGVDECTEEKSMKDKNGEITSQSFTFRRSEMKPGFFVFLTGNEETDGVTTHALSKSAQSRLKPIIVTRPALLDWQHRICQGITGLPVSTIYFTGKEHWDKNPEAFARRLKELRLAGLSEEERRNVPPLQMELLTGKKILKQKDDKGKNVEVVRYNWQDVMEASQKIASLFDKWSQLTNPKSPLAQKMPDVCQELDESYQGQVGVDFRKIIDFCQDACSVKSAFSTAVSTIDEGDITVRPTMKFNLRPQRDGNFGTRLSQGIYDAFVETADDRGKPELFKQLKKAAEDCGIIPPSLKSAGKKDEDSRLIADLLNVKLGTASPEASVSAELVRTQKLLCGLLRRTYPEIKATDNEIMTTTAVESAMEQVSADEEGLLMPNTNLESLAKTPFVPVGVLDFYQNAETIKGVPEEYRQPPEDEQAPEGEDLTAVSSAPREDFIDMDQFLTSLAVPALRQRNFEALWKGSRLEASGVIKTSTKSNVADMKEAFAMGEGRSASGLAATCVMTRKVIKDTCYEVPLLILRDCVRDQTLVVGPATIDAGLIRGLGETSVTYVSRDDKDGKRKVENFITQNLNATKEHLNVLALAMSFRISEANATDDKLLPPLPNLMMMGPKETVSTPLYLFDPEASAEKLGIGLKKKKGKHASPSPKA